jgi:hypothetical protein
MTLCKIFLFVYIENVICIFTLGYYISLLYSRKWNNLDRILPHFIFYKGFIH